jgi:hypothetical protein
MTPIGKIQSSNNLNNERYSISANRNSSDKSNSIQKLKGVLNSDLFGDMTPLKRNTKFDRYSGTPVQSDKLGF